MPDVYRWLRTGHIYTYRAAVGKGLDERRGQACKLLTIGNGRGPRNCLVEFADGVRVVCSWGVLRDV